MPDPRPVPPGGAVGILGGGQLGRMLAAAASELGLKTHVFCPDHDAPAFDVATARTVAGYDDEKALAAFARSVDVVTFEFENVPARAGEVLAANVPVYPNPQALAVAQDRLAEKTLIQELGIPVPPFAAVNEARDIYSGLGRAGRPAVLKTRRLGYDGKGQAAIRTGDDPSHAWRLIGEQPAILESFVDFRCELSVLVARDRQGATLTYDVAQNRHERHVLAETTVPAAIDAATDEAARQIGVRIAEALDYVGVLAVELFLVDRPEGPVLLVNEIAPRVHNSFHWTQDAALTSQFEQHVRAVCGWPLGDPCRHSDVVMTNLLGESAARWQVLAGEPRTRLHLYGKREARPGRKMGHVNRLAGPSASAGKG
jgi:5-(carboxyamino)imidazole ribonucleotide synthase